jgi:hypothetical protein
MIKLHIKVALLIFLMSLSIQNIQAQIPVNDPSWVKQTSKCEEFNAPVDSVSKWYKGWPYLDYHGSAEIVLSSNLIFASGDTTIKIQADTLIRNPIVQRSNRNGDSVNPYTVDIVYQGGAMQTRPVSGVDQYKFGYVEISAKFPTGYYSLWPAFWMWSASCDSSYYNEIDIAENYPGVSYPGTGMGTNIWINPDTCEPAHDNGRDVFGLPLLSSAFHKFAVQWGPDRVIWYFDDQPVRSFYDADGDSIPQHAMAVILNFAVSHYYSWLPNNWINFSHLNSLPTNYPRRFEIDYLRYYKLSPDCNANSTICIPINDYDRKVKQWIKTGGTCSPIFNPTTTNASYTLRATDYIILDAGTTIDPTSAGFFAAEILECPQ